MLQLLLRRLAEVELVHAFGVPARGLLLLGGHGGEAADELPRLRQGIPQVPDQQLQRIALGLEAVPLLDELVAGILGKSGNGKQQAEGEGGKASGHRLRRSNRF